MQPRSVFSLVVTGRNPAASDVAELLTAMLRAYAGAQRLIAGDEAAGLHLLDEAAAIAGAVHQDIGRRSHRRGADYLAKIAALASGMECVFRDSRAVDAGAVGEDNLLVVAHGAAWSSLAPVTTSGPRDATRQLVTNMRAAVLLFARACSSALSSVPTTIAVLAQIPTALAAGLPPGFWSQVTESAPAGELGAPADDAAAIQAALTSGGVSPPDVQNAIASYTGLPASQQNAIVAATTAFASGGTPSLSMFLPLIAGGLALSGFGAPVVAAVAGLLQLVPALLGALGISFGAPSCAWKVGATCFTGHVPYGPTDPIWQTWAQFTANTDTKPAFIVTPSDPVGPVSGKNDLIVDGAFPWYRDTIACELRDLLAVVPFSRPPVLGKTDAVSSFLRVYYHAWQLAAEMAINGHPRAADYPLLIAVQNAWNAGHASTSTVKLTPKTGSPSPFCMSATFVELLLNGDVDGSDHPPLTLNTGPALAATTGTSSTASSSSSSTLGTIAKVGVAGAAAVGAWYLVDPSSWWHAVRAITNLFPSSRERR